SGLHVTTLDSATYAHVIASAYIETDARAVSGPELQAALAFLNRVPGRAGYVTEVFCEKARYFHPANGERIDVIRDTIEERWAQTPLYPVLLTSLLEAADRVDSTTGLQMAFLKSWAPRALRPIELRMPHLLAGAGRAIRGDASEIAAELHHADIAYLDPPYNNHRYFTNYHVWETLVRWDAPDYYGVACKRVDCREPETASVFNKRRTMPAALSATVDAVDAELLLVSYNDESWLSPEELVAMCWRAVARRRAVSESAVSVLGVDQARYVGAQIGIHNAAGEKVGTVSHLRNTELLVFAGPKELVSRACAAGRSAAARSGLRAFEVLPAVDGEVAFPRDLVTQPFGRALSLVAPRESR
ncbi:MAG: DNA adenine methylase, partial [Acidimicrobiales bacterium]